MRDSRAYKALDPDGWQPLARNEPRRDGVRRAGIVVVGGRSQTRADRIARVCSAVGLSVAIVAITEEVERAAPASMRIIDSAGAIRVDVNACRLLRSRAEEAPIICITPPRGSHARARLLEAGADCALEEPLTSRELLASVIALLRRSTTRSDDFTTAAPDLHRLSAAEVTALGRTLRLTETERRLLERIRHGDDAIPSATLLETVLERRRIDPDSAVLRVHMSRLRKKLRPIGWTIEGLHGFGYRVVPVCVGQALSRCRSLSGLRTV